MRVRRVPGTEPGAPHGRGRMADRTKRVDRQRAPVLGHVTSVRANRAYWNRISLSYQNEHDPQIGASPRLWGNFFIPDAELNALGDVTGKRVLELGCGAGQWSRALAAEAGRVVGLDLFEAQLGAARRAMGPARYALVQGAAESLPFAAASFDLVFCDHGGLSWAPAEVGGSRGRPGARPERAAGVQRAQPAGDGLL